MEVVIVTVVEEAIVGNSIAIVTVIFRPFD